MNQQEKEKLKEDVRKAKEKLAKAERDLIAGSMTLGYYEVLDLKSTIHKTRAELKRMGAK